MRVVVISVVIFIAIAIASIGYMTENTAPSVNPATTTSAVQNPFEDSATKNRNIELPTLPTAATEDTSTPSPAPADNQAAPQSSTISQNNDEIGKSSASEMNKEEVAASTATTVVNPESNSTRVSESNRQVGTVASEKPRKLGLAMLELEREKKRNIIGVIVNLQNPQDLSASEIRAMYLDRLTQWNDGSKVLLYNLPLGDKYREKFSKQILNMTALEVDQIEAERREAHTKINPVEVKASNIVVSYVEQHPNAIAYVPLSMVHDKSNVRVIFTIP